MSQFYFREEFLPTSLSKLAQRMFPRVNLYSLIEKALKDTCCHEDPRCEIPNAIGVLAGVLASLYRHDDLETVFRRCMALLGKRTLTEVSPGNIDGVRARVPKRAFIKLLDLIVKELPVSPTFYGLVVKAMDGSYWTLFDSNANANTFGRSTNQSGESEYPKMLAVALITVYDRVVRSLRCYRYNQDEHKAALDFLPSLDPGDLLLLDRGFPGKELLVALTNKKVEFVARISNADWAFTNIRKVSEGDAEVEFAGLKLRLIEFVVGKEPVRLLTSLPMHIPKGEFFDLYHQRWVIETVWGLLKRVLAAARHGHQDIEIRAKSPDLVVQEIYCHAITLNLVAHEGALAAEKKGMDPSRFSFSTWVNLTRISIENDLDISQRDILFMSPQARLPDRPPGRVYDRTQRAAHQRFSVKKGRHVQERQAPSPTFGTTSHTVGRIAKQRAQAEKEAEAETKAQARREARDARGPTKQRKSRTPPVCVG
jgi:hypothetical protein